MYAIKSPMFANDDPHIHDIADVVPIDENTSLS